MIIINRDNLEIIQNDFKCKWCNKCLEQTNQKCVEYMKSEKRGLSKCPFGYSSFFSDRRIYCGLVVKDFSDLKKINGHIKLSGGNLDYSILTKEDANAFIGSYEKNFLYTDEYSDINIVNYHTYRNTVHSIKNTIRTLNAFSRKQDLDYTSDDYDEEGIQEVIQDLRDIKSGVDLIRTILDYHDQIIYGDNPQLATTNYYNLVKPHSMIVKLSKTLGNEAKLKKISIKRYGNPLIKINNNSKMLYIMLFIALENAIKYSPNNSNIIVDMDDIDQEKTRVNITNKADGLSNDDLDSLFDYGYRGSNSYNINGTGVGMAVLKKIADATKTECNLSLDKDLFTVSFIIHSINE